MLCEFLGALALPPALIIGNSHTPITRAFCRRQESRFALSPRVFAGWCLKQRTLTVGAMLGRAATSQGTAASLAINRSVWRGFIEPEHDLRGRARLISAPTLLLFGAQDPVISARQDGRLGATLIAGAKLVVMPAGHAPFAEVPDQFLTEVGPFLERCAAAGERDEGRTAATSRGGAEYRG